MSVTPTDATRHDLSLFAIAAVLLIGLVVAQFTTVELASSLFVASLPAAACVGYVLFYRPPAKTAR
jgi:hypothetical protein